MRRIGILAIILQCRTSWREAGSPMCLLAVSVIGLMGREGQKTQISQVFLRSTLSSKWRILKMALEEAHYQSESPWL